MIKSILNFFQKEKSTPQIKFIHEKLGKMIYWEEDGTWETINNPIFHGGIDGTSLEPSEKSINDANSSNKCNF